MSEIPGALAKIDQKEVDYKAAVSSATMTKIGGSINGLISIGNEPLGTVIQSILTVAQFNSIRSSSAWVRMEGQSIIGSDLHALTSLASLPDMVTGKRFLRQTDSDGNLMTLEVGHNASHDHTIYYRPFIGTNSDDKYSGSPLGSNASLDNTGDFRAWDTSVYSITSDGGVEARPINMQVNFFIKINNSI